MIKEIMNTTIINKYNHLITTVCVGVFLSSVAIYMYFLSLSVIHVVMQKETIHSLSEAKSEIAKLETSYIDARHIISLQVASEYGFTENQNKIFVSRAAQNLAYRTGE